MNFNPELTTPIAILMSLTAAFLWGSWFISLKYLGDYPLDGFYVVLFTTSLLFVWGVGFLLDGSALLRNISDVYTSDPSRVIVSLVCGCLYVFGMRISLYVIKTIGLSLAQPLSASVNILGGTTISALVGGIPEGMTSGKIILAAIFLFSAVMFSLISGNLHTRAQASARIKSSLRFTMKDMWRSLGLAFLSSAFIPAYTFGLSYGLHSVTQSKGLAVLPYMALLVSGAFIGMMLSSGSLLTLRKQWQIVLHAPLSIHKFGIISGLCHYGGNIIHTFATSYLSSVISWPLGITSGLWTQLWGLVYGEFRGAPAIVYITLFIGIALYLLGAYTIAF